MRYERGCQNRVGIVLQDRNCVKEHLNGYGCRKEVTAI